VIFLWQKTGAILAKIEETVIILISALMAILACMQVIGRYTPFPFSAGFEELIRYLFIWSTMLAGAVAARRQTHQGVDFFVHFLPKKLIKIVDIYNHLISVAVCFVLALISYRLAARLFAVGQISPSNGFPNWFITIVLPIGFLLMAFYYFGHFIADLRTRKEVDL
jgi:C4-dicarboxylate transporter DctQ subunit